MSPGFANSEVYQGVLEALQTGICVVDRERRIVFWNDGAERITGYLRHEVVGHSCEQNVLKHCNGDACELCGETCPLSTALRDAKSVEATGFIHHKAGHRILVRTWTMPVRNEHGNIIGAVSSFDARKVVPEPDRRAHDLSAYGVLDAVTGVANRAMLQTRLRETLTTFLELNVPFGVLCIQLGNLNRFRASYGHEAAATMLRVLAQTVEISVRPTDFVGRWSEDQFLVILTNCNLEAFESIRERVRKMVASSGIEWWGEELHLAAGVEKMTAEAEDTLERLLQRVEEAFARINGERASAASAGGTVSAS